MKNVTITIDETILKKARHDAVEHDQSLSQWVSGLIIKAVERKSGLSQARERALKRLKKGFSLKGMPLKREEIYDRG